MKSKILALSKNEEFKKLLKMKKVTNKYVTIFFGNIENKDNKRLNISFSVKKKSEMPSVATKSKEDCGQL